ncbi:uncharacterized protein MELLADRAFT_107060 [Melampsora larici-populina 98AG31]|uniref:Uncharacterized protein n=1 Tax=Melampsora larici-populina (strain 98AG31 / pathotype 3-4-7) TaxID=747676 RepID=F4RNJ2_MELLP|nr:uncharacterized protein MELLADRAFT_107060 [Melampsora larici-populina 98AG31]EGG06086.1 hypothetical protein MELLADRAFT_107060 [Melampsora larici-populina 98AG31]
MLLTHLFYQSTYKEGKRLQAALVKVDLKARRISLLIKPSIVGEQELNNGAYQAESDNDNIEDEELDHSNVEKDNSVDMVVTSKSANQSLDVQTMMRVFGEASNTEALSEGGLHWRKDDIELGLITAEEAARKMIERKQAGDENAGSHRMAHIMGTAKSVRLNRNAVAKLLSVVDANGVALQNNSQNHKYEDEDDEEIEEIEDEELETLHKSEYKFIDESDDDGVEECEN